MDLRIRSATKSDLPELVSLLGQLFAQEAEFEPDADKQRRGLTQVIENPQAGIISVAVRDNRCVGMVIVLYTVSTALGARVGILEDMVVDEAVRGAGIGDALLSAALDRAQRDGCNRVTLLTDHDNLRTHSFYTSNGFERSQMIVFRRNIARAH